jgi:APA family basic amino acid/polyamine antiporter
MIQGIFIVSSDMVRQLGSAGWLIAMWVLTGTITIAAVSYGELSAMFKSRWTIYILRRRKTRWFLYGWSFFAVIQTGTIAAVGCFAKFTAYLFPIVSDKNILYEIGDFNLNAAQVVHFHHRFTQLY